ncbi:MAG: Gfo/Idh/MocA family oxidoreductase [Bacteroidota bacterium]
MIHHTRRGFLQKASLGSFALAGVAKGAREVRTIRPSIGQNVRQYAANDQVRVGFIGCGIQGFSNARQANKVPGVEIAAGCDLYSGRLTRMKEIFGSDVVVTRDYRELLDRDDIDAICISTSDHWHDHMLKAALSAGKPVYCEKPMMHHIEEGRGMIEAERKSGLPVQIGSQYASAIDTHKAKELYEAGEIGELVLMDIRYDRASSNGAWQYSIPTDAGQDTVDWDSFLGDAPKQEYDEKRFFRWRNYGDYGTGVAGDLFVHLFTALHVITSSDGPEKIYATGGLRFWKDGRDAPDITLALLDYPSADTHPAFNVQMRVNFVDGSGGGSSVRLIGSEGVMTLGWDGVKIERNPVDTRPTYGGWDSYATFSAAQQKEYEAWYAANYPVPQMKMQSPRELVYKTPDGYSAHYDHWHHFIKAVREGTKLIEDTTFGMRAAGPALASNLSMSEERIIKWDPVMMRTV